MKTTRTMWTISAARDERGSSSSSWTRVRQRRAFCWR